ncbi:MAG: hypothetical protein E6Q97_05805 [Desulfurellales bacterium]|nr:MAG: hypothetical protein E6Q97_05805 [Desulfurellales bacterium]
MTGESNNAPISADDAFDAAVAIAHNIVAKSPEGERLNRALEHAQFVMTPWRQRNPVEWSQLNRAAADFAAPYLRKIAELEKQLTNADPRVPADYVRRLRAALTAEHPEVIIDAAARVVRERNDALARIAELETEARRNRIAIDALTESGKASAGIVAKLESDNKALHDALARATMDSLGKAIRGES